MKLEELTVDDKIILRAMIELVPDAKVIHQTLQAGNFNGLRSLTIGQINQLINDLVDYDSNFDIGGLGDLDDLEDML